MKKASLLSSVCVGVLGIFIGILLLKTPIDFLFKIFFIGFGVLTLISGVPQLVFSISNLGSKPKESVFDMILAIITICLGLILMFIQSKIALIIVGAHLIVFPVIRVLLSGEKLLQLKKEMPIMILGIIMVVVGHVKAKGILFDIAGIIIIVLSVFYMIFGIVATKKINSKQDNNII